MYWGIKMESNKRKYLLGLVNNKPCKIILIIAIITMVVSSAFAIYLHLNSNKEAVDAFSTDEKGAYVNYTVELLTEYVATYTTDSKVDKYYVASDGNYLMILKIKDSDISKFKDIIDYTYGKTEVDPEPLKVNGVYKQIPSELRKIVIEYYNKNLSNKVTMTTDNFEDYFGICYIDTSATPYDNYMIWASMFSYIGGTAAFIAAIVLISNHARSKKALKNLGDSSNIDTIYEEINGIYSEKFEKHNVILTTNYVIDYTNFLTILNYKDIVWMYEYTYRYNGVESQRFIKIMDKNRKMSFICSKNTLGGNYDLFKEFFKKLADRCPNCLIGYTKDNIEKTNKKNFNETLNEINAKNTLS